ncbi:MAG: DedA family protein [Actinobacteria bacterium]|nr:DedA family protein [Actinomycetota bacterium]
MGGLTEAITSWIADYGLYAIFILSLLDAVLPAASELVMVYGGALAAGAFSAERVNLAGDPIESTLWAFLAVAVAGTVGYILGSIGGWAIGLYGGRPYLERHGRWLHLTPDKLDEAERWFERWGNTAVLVSRCLPLVRSFISIPAGVAQMPLARYTGLTTLGTIPWYFGLAAIGVAAGASWERVHESWHYADYAIIALLAAALALFVARTYRKRTRRRAMESA